MSSSSQHDAFRRHCCLEFTYCYACAQNMKLHSSMPHWMSPVENCSNSYCLIITDCINTKEKFKLIQKKFFFAVHSYFLAITSRV